MAVSSATEAPARHALILHGWNDDPWSGWLGWLGAELRQSGWETHVPVFVTPEGRPDRVAWTEELAKLQPYLQPSTIVIAHSLGCWLAMLLLGQATITTSIAATYLVAGFYDAPRPQARRFFSPEPDWQQLAAACPEWHCFSSQDDWLVVPERTARLAERLSAQLHTYPNYGHFLGSKGMATFPELLALIQH